MGARVFEIDFLPAGVMLELCPVSFVKLNFVSSVIG